jgi:hypothetical protein
MTSRGDTHSQQQGTRPRIYHSTRCAHSKMLLDIVQRAPQLKTAFLLVDVDLIPAHHREKLAYVPTLVMSDGSVLVGAQAVQWASKYIVQEEDHHTIKSGSEDVNGGGDFEEFLLYDRTPYSNLNDTPETSFAVIRQGYDFFST